MNRAGSAAFALLLGHASLVAAEEKVLVAPGTIPRMACGQAPPDWRTSASDDDFSERVEVPDAGTGCAAPQLLRWRFDVPKDTPHAGLVLHVRYQHAFVAYLNGVEVARRSLPADSTLETLAIQVHGPEWELIPIATSALRIGQSNLLAIEVHPRTLGREPSADASLTATDGPRYTHGPYLLEVTTERARVAFETDLPTTAEVRFGAAEPDALAKEIGAAFGKHHVFELSPLRNGATFSYRVLARGVQPDMAVADTGVIPFHTPPTAGRPLRFVIYGDVRSGHDVHAELVRAIRAEDPDLAIMTGDLVDMGSDEADWDRYFEVAGPLIRSVPVYPTPGNHEYAQHGRGAERYYALFRTPRPDDEVAGYHSFDVAGVHFIALDANQYKVPAQLAWLERDLIAAQKGKIRGTQVIIAYAHEGAYSSGVHGDNPIAKAQYAPLLEKYGVTLYVSGHDHHYERGRVGRLDYLVSGGGGAELRTQRCGVPGRKACPPRVAALANEHHYIVVDVLPGLLRICPKRPDGTPIEACVTRPLLSRAPP